MAMRVLLIEYWAQMAAAGRILESPSYHWQLPAPSQLPGVKVINLCRPSRDKALYAFYMPLAIRTIRQAHKAAPRCCIYL